MIPKGKDYTFTVKVNEADSFIAQDLTNMLTAKLDILLASTGCSVITAPIDMTVQDAINGVLKCTVLAAETAKLSIDRGDAVDDYYLKPMHQATITVTFSDATPEVFAVLQQVYAVPVGCIV